MRTLNVPLLLVIVFVVAAAATGTYFVHEWQVHRNAQFLLTLADRFEASDQVGQAVGSLGRYVALEPDDTDALARLGLLHASRGNDAQAFVVLEQVLRRQPMRDDVRRTLVDVAMRIGRFSDARDHLEQYLLRADRKDAPLLNLLGTCQEKLGDSAAAVKQFQLAIEAKPDYLESYIALARLYTRMKEPGRANKVLQALVDNNPGSENGYRAYLLRGAFRYQQMAAPMSQVDRDNLLSLAEDDAREALLFDVDKSEALLLAAKLARLRAQANGDDQASRDLAHEYIAQGLALYDGQHTENDALLPGFYRLLASLELDDGRRDLAIEALRRGVTQVEQRGEKANLRWSLAEALIDDDQLPEAQTVVDALRTEAAFAPFVAYLDARIKFANDDWQSSTSELERLRPRLADVPDLAKQVDFWLGRGYGMLNREDLELAAYRRAIEADDHWVAPHCMLAEALAKSGRTQHAGEQYQQAMRLPGCPPQAYKELARLRVVENLRQPLARQDWDALQPLLNAAAQRLPDSAEIAVLQAQVEVAREEWDAARERLEQAAEGHPTELAVWTARIALERLTGNLQKAEELLDSAQVKLGDRVELRLERAALLESRDSAAAAPELLDLASQAEAFSADERARLRIGLARHLQAVGALPEAKKLVLQVIDDAPQNLAANLILFDMAAAENDESGLTKWLSGIEKCQDPDVRGLLLYGDALRLVLAVERSTDRASKADQARLQKASDELTEAWGERRWPRLPLLQARIEELREKPARVIPWLQQAVEWGAGDEVAIRLIVLLAGQKDYEQAGDLLLLLDKKQVALTPEVAPWAFAALSNRNDYGKALELAHKACVASNNWHDHLWFGTIAAKVVLSGKLRSPDEKQQWLTAAEQEIDRAIELDAHEIEAWFGLLSFYAQTQRSSDLEASIERAKQQLPENHFHLLLARYYQSIDDLPTARQQLELALNNSPDDAMTLRYAAEFYLQRQELAAARKVLEHLLEPQVSAGPQDHAFARQSLAVVYLADRNYRSFLKGVELAKGENFDLPANRRALAILLGRSPVGADHRQAIELFKQLAAQSLLADTDRYLLAQLCWLDRRRPEAMEIMEGLLEKSANNSTFIAGYANMLLDEKGPDDADRWIKRLEGLEPQAVRTVELRARALACWHRETKAVEVLEKLLTSGAVAGPAFDHGQLAVLLENLGTWKPAHDAPRPDELFAAAEKHFRRAADDSPPNSPPYAALAGFLGRHGKMKEALRIYDDLWQHDQLEAAAIGYADLTARRKLAPPQLATVEKQIAAVLPEHSESIVLLSALARIYRAQERFDEVDATYRKIIEINPDNVIALNNLSVLLTLRGRNRDEARQLIDRAVELGGPTPALLDSRAMVKLATGEADSAIDDLKQATADETSPDFYFHLAQAEILRHDGAAAAQALDQARSLGLDDQSLHPLERDAYQQLLALVPQPAAEPALSPGK